MGDTEDFTAGRSPFPLHDNDKDYSGLDLHKVFLVDSDALSHSFLNGTNLVDVAFQRASLDQSEFAEAYIERSVFRACDLSGSDFVRTRVSDTVFEGCTFENGEWRETEFVNVQFLGCNFTHTTINLCTFSGCTFGNGTIASLNHRSVNYNIFIFTQFDENITSEHVLSQNFGLPGGASQLPVRLEGVPSLSEVCRRSDTPLFRVRDLVAAIEAESGRQTVRSNKLVLEFMANIVVALASTRRISPSSMLYIEQIFAGLARTTTSNVDFRAAMSAVVNIRNAMYDLVTGLRSALPDVEGEARRITAYFEDNFEEETGEELAEVLSELFFERPGAVKLASIRHGSTFLDFVMTASMPTITVVSTLGLIFTQADLIVSKTSQIKDGVKKIFGKKEAESTALVPVDPQPEKVPAILKSGTVLPELGPIRIAVERSGKTLIMLDNRVEITILP